VLCLRCGVRCLLFWFVLVDIVCGIVAQVVLFLAGLCVILVGGWNCGGLCVCRGLSLIVCLWFVVWCFAQMLVVVLVIV